MRGVFFLFFFSSFLNFKSNSESDAGAQTPESVLISRSSGACRRLAGLEPFWSRSSTISISRSDGRSALVFERSPSRMFRLSTHLGRELPRLRLRGTHNCAFCSGRLDTGVSDRHPLRESRRFSLDRPRSENEVSQYLNTVSAPVVHHMHPFAPWT